MTPFTLRNRRVWVAGHRGLAGGAVVRRLIEEGADILVAGRAQLDLRRQAEVEQWMAAHRPEVIVLAAATVGGIGDNAARPADYLFDNLAIQNNVIHGAYRQGVEKLLFLGSSCIYPRAAETPIREEALLTGPLEPTNEAYALAKIAGLKLCQAYRRQHGCRFIAAMPCNLYGPGDRFDAARAHVIPALMTRLHRARLAQSAQVTLWGTGDPVREFLYVDDLAEALVMLLQTYEGEAPVNIGSGEEITIAGLAAEIAALAGYDGEIAFDPAHPDGTPRKTLDSRTMRLMGWAPRTLLADGLRQTYAWYLDHLGTTGAGAARAA